MKDCIIIGSGIAGISAALTLKANGKTFQIFGNAGLSEKISKAESIRNYPAFYNVTGQALVRALQDQIEKEDIEIITEKVSGVYALKDKFGVATQEGGYYESRTVIFACGVESVKTVKGETEFLGRGVSYCATCDGFLYKDKTIAVLCTSKRLEHEIEHLAGFAKTVYLIPMYKDVTVTGENIQTVLKMPLEIMGEKRVEKVVFADREIIVDGFFALRECIAPNAIMDGLQTENGHIAVSRDMQTNIVGCFACGDCVGRPYQYAKAAGDGNVAAHSVTAYLATKK